MQSFHSFWWIWQPDIIFCFFFFSLASAISSMRIWCKHNRSHQAIINKFFAVNSVLSIGLCLNDGINYIWQLTRNLSSTTKAFLWSKCCRCILKIVGLFDLGWTSRDFHLSIFTLIQNSLQSQNESVWPVPIMSRIPAFDMNMHKQLECAVMFLFLMFLWAAMCLHYTTYWLLEWRKRQWQLSYKVSNGRGNL